MLTVITDGIKTVSLLGISIMQIMKRISAVILSVCMPVLLFGSRSRLFNTSVVFDMLCSIQYFDEIKDSPEFKPLTSDMNFMRNLEIVNNKAKASRLCNLYAQLHGNRYDVDECLSLFSNINQYADSVAWAAEIMDVSSEMTQVLQSLVEAGYPQYWRDSIYPKLIERIDAYPVDNKMIGTIDRTISEFSGDEKLSAAGSNIYILNIKNAFNLVDESFCCTPLILDSEIEKQLRLSFVNIYVHENLHKLHISDSLMRKLENLLMHDDFYAANESIARKHDEGGNEAFVVAAEVFLSRKLGLRDDKSVCDELSEYVDGSLVLAPIIYVNLERKYPDETLNDFILRLFDEGVIRAGDVERQYSDAMAIIKSRVVADGNMSIVSQKPLVCSPFEYSPAPSPNVWQVLGKVFLESTREYLSTH